MMVLEWSVKKMLPLHLADVYTVHFSITIPLSSLQSFTGPSPFCLSGCFSFSLLCAHFFFSRFEADEPGDNDTAPLYASYHSDDRWLPRCASSWEALECVCVWKRDVFDTGICVYSCFCMTETEGNGTWVKVQVCPRRRERGRRGEKASREGCLCLFLRGIPKIHWFGCASAHCADVYQWLSPQKSEHNWVKEGNHNRKHAGTQKKVGGDINFVNQSL